MYVQFFANLFVNIDMGILPAGSTKIKEELGLDNTQFGALGSVVYLGQTIGSALATFVLQTFNPKLILGLCLFLNIGTLILFTFTDIYAVLVVCRMCTGLFQVFFCIYFPVWADVFGNDIQKSTWLTYLLIASPLGVVMGYGITAAFLENIGWRWAFYTQSVLLLPSLLGIFISPKKYVDVTSAAKAIALHKKEIALKAIAHKSPKNEIEIEKGEKKEEHGDDMPQNTELAGSEKK